MAEKGTVKEQMEACTHNCMSCGLGCDAGDKGSADKVTLEKALYQVSELDSEELLKALEEF